MSHRPGRPQGLDQSEAERIAREIDRRRRPWGDLAELSEWIARRARAGRNVILSPWTAGIVAAHLEKAAAKPSRDEIALMVCRLGSRDRCKEACMECTGRANEIVRAYGCRLD